MHQAAAFFDAFCQDKIWFCSPMIKELLQASQDMREAVLRIQDSCLSKYPLSDTQVYLVPHMSSQRAWWCEGGMQPFNKLNYLECVCKCR